jgi:hypothetical protein
MLLKWMVFFILLGASTGNCFSADPARPACNKKTAGKYWPEAANHDHKAFTKLAKCGELQMCFRDIWRYKWEFLTVRLDQLRGGSHFVKPAGCEVLPDPPAEETADSVASSTK